MFTQRHIVFGLFLAAMGFAPADAETPTTSLQLSDSLAASLETRSAMGCSRRRVFLPPSPNTRAPWFCGNAHCFKLGFRYRIRGRCQRN